MALRAQVVDLVGLHLLQDAGEVAGIRQVAVVQHEVLVIDMGIFVDMVDPLGIEKGGAALDAVNFVALFEQKLCQVGTVLAGDAGDECFFHNSFNYLRLVLNFSYSSGMPQKITSSLRIKVYRISLPSLSKRLYIGATYVSLSPVFRADTLNSA